jgi:mRNA-degrading endonuclease RelE of RelBE toxin-antitoxin system
MRVLQTPAVEAALRTLSAEDRRQVLASFDQLVEWENDAGLRAHVKQVNPSDNMYVLKMNGEFRILFRPDHDQIVIVELIVNSEFPAVGTPEWGRMNQRRAELIRKKNRKGLSSEEQIEHERLQRLSHDALETQFPRPSLSSESDGRGK